MTSMPLNPLQGAHKCVVYCLKQNYKAASWYTHDMDAIFRRERKSTIMKYSS